ncbi:unnamed protein product [Pleuronectes platessa]|uniref:Uncharacterized protein n=1 Tax=Pleuronectes platessa TaxID=8262 RepID=A0A9N7UYD1_PLEPL|nr:unnamed protein product [Pleuronectes platessa]
MPTVSCPPSRPPVQPPASWTEIQKHCRSDSKEVIVGVVLRESSCFTDRDTSASNPAQIWLLDPGRSPSDSQQDLVTAPRRQRGEQGGRLWTSSTQQAVGAPSVRPAHLTH